MGWSTVDRTNRSEELWDPERHIKGTGKLVIKRVLK